MKSPLSGRPTAMLDALARRALYVFIGFPLSLFSFVMMVTGLSVGAGTLITFIGLPILVAVLFVARGIATVERRLLTNLIDAEPTPVAYKEAAEGSSPIKRMTTALTDRQSWFDVVHGIISFPVSVATWTVLVTWVSVAGAGLTSALWLWSIPSGPNSQDLPELLGLGSSYLVKVIFYSGAGLLAAITLPFVLYGTAWLRATLAKILLVDPATQAQQIVNLEQGRQAARSAEDTSFRRLERDIHDGPQQRLVRLSMDLGRAEMHATDADPKVKDALADAKRQANETLDELRSLSRGIAPPILVDRGLASAIEELAARSAIPANVDIDLDQPRFESHVESTVYFIVSEALTNSAKHSRGSVVNIRLRQEAERIWVTVTDDGLGGAHPSKGHGLVGLEQRVRSVDGRLEINSPEGGPTVLVAEVPCGS